MSVPSWLSALLFLSAKRHDNKLSFRRALRGADLTISHASSAPATVRPFSAIFCHPGKTCRLRVGQDRAQHFHPVVGPQRVIQPSAAAETGQAQGLGLDGLNKVARLVASRACALQAGIIIYPRCRMLRSWRCSRHKRGLQGRRGRCPLQQLPDGGARRYTVQGPYQRVPYRLGGLLGIGSLWTGGLGIGDLGARGFGGRGLRVLDDQLHHQGCRGPVRCRLARECGWLILRNLPAHARGHEAPKPGP